MPADDPGACPPDEAKRVAAYVHDTFYVRRGASTREQPRIALSRLTVREHQAAIADLTGSFGVPVSPGFPRGLQGQYFTHDRERDGDYVFERIDSRVRFNFREASPAAGKIEPREFAIYWLGAVLAPESGEYEFIVRSENSVRLWVNDLVAPRIDAWVKSGNETEYRATVRLLGGRAYPLRLDFAKGLSGVAQNDEQKAKTAIGTASVALEWRRPSGVTGPIPQRYLAFAEFPEKLVITTPFPPDDRSLGYERGNSVSQAWSEATTAAAIEAAEYVTARLHEIVGRDQLQPADEPLLRQYCHEFAARAFRRPLDAEQEDLYVNHNFENTDDLRTAVELCVLKVLTSPRFLYRETGADDPYAVAERLALALWDSIPDADLIRAAAAGNLGTREQVAEQARRMAGDWRAISKLREFVLGWLKIDPSPRLARDETQYPGFDTALVADLRQSLELQLADLLVSKDADFRKLLLDDEVYLNGPLAAFYGVELPADAPFQAVKLDSPHRAGLLTHPYLMAALSDSDASSPIRRGVFLARNVLGRHLRPAPEAFAPLAAKMHPDLTTRQRTELQTGAKACQSCHALINPLGFALEGFDAVGRFRSSEHGRPIDSRGSYTSRSGNVSKLNGGRELAAFLADSDEVHSALVEKLFQFSVKQPIRAFGWQTAPHLRESLVKSDFNLRELLIEIAVTFAHRSPTGNMGMEAQLPPQADSASNTR